MVKIVGSQKGGAFYILVAGIIILAAALVFESLAIYHAIGPGHVKTSGTSKITKAPTAGFNIYLTAPAYSVESFTVTVSGTGFNESQSAKLGPKIYALNSSEVKGISTASGPIKINSSMELNGTAVVPENETRMLFTGLEPYSNYTVTVKGSESPYCFPGLACPMFVLAISKTYGLRTGPPNSTANYSISLFPSPNLNSNATIDGCSVGLPLAINQSSYTSCSDGSRLLNFVLSQVNSNGTITGLVYPYYGFVSNTTIKPSKQVFHNGQEVSFSCSGYVAYMHNASYAGQYALFKVIKVHPIPCPAEIG